MKKFTLEELAAKLEWEGREYIMELEPTMMPNQELESLLEMVQRGWDRIFEIIPEAGDI